jgi:pSer/pThr/pTyr-binding forkhead associated (FHA) protein
VVEPAKRLTPLPTLVVTSEGELQGKSLNIDGEEMMLGRRTSNDLVIDDPRVSRSHGLVRRSKGTVWLEDLGSTGGTFVNGDPITSAQRLHHGDVVRFGAVETRFEDHGSLMESDEATESFDLSELQEKPVLSERQKEVLRYLRDGLTNPEIAKRLGVTERTVKAHCQEVFDRLGARNRTSAVAAAHRLDLLADE